MVRGKDEAENKRQFESLVEKLKKAKKVGVLTKDSPQGPFAKEWKSIYQPEAQGIEEVDISVALSTVMSVKDEAELVGKLFHCECLALWQN